ncbi:hypothetical protein [Azospirillum sp. sgz302134]
MMTVSSLTGEAGASAPVSPPFQAGRLIVTATVEWSGESLLIHAAFDADGVIKACHAGDDTRVMDKSCRILTEMLAEGVPARDLPASLSAHLDKPVLPVAAIARTLAEMERDSADAVRLAYAARANRVRGVAA